MTGFRYLSDQETANAKTSICLCADSSKPSLLIHKVGPTRW